MSIFSFIGYTQTELFRKPDNWRQIYKQTIRLFVHQTMGLKRVEKKKYCEMTVWLLLKLIQKQPPEAFCTKPVLSKTLQYLQDKQVLKSLFYSGYCDIFKSPILKNICEQLLLKMCSLNWKKRKNFFNINIRNGWKCLFLFHDWFPMKLVFT